MSEPVEAQKWVRHFRQALLWPLQLMPIHEGAQIQKHWEYLERAGANNPWREENTAFPQDPAQFRERHYNEFIAFLPYVQRFLYGEGQTPARDGRCGDSPMRVFRRDDVKAVRVTPRRGAEPRTLALSYVDLYFFYDLDIVLLSIEFQADNILLHEAQELLYRFGRAYPASWEKDGSGLHCPERVEWLDGSGNTLAVSDYEKHDKFLGFVCRNHSASIAAHWEFLLRPMVLDASGDQAPIRYRQLEFYRMPVMGYFAMDHLRALTRADFVRLGLVTAPGEGNALPFHEQHVADFELRHCYDRYWNDDCAGNSTRLLCSGYSLVLVGSAGSPLFMNEENGVLGQFGHQYFLLFLIAHMQRAALLMFSNRLVEALDQLDITDAESVKRFKRVIRQNFEIFLRFTHRYWFHELSEQAQIKALYHMCNRHLGTEAIYAEVKQEIYDMNQYLDSDSLRRQANTVVRLTVVTTFGLIGTVVTGFLGMNLLAEADASLGRKLLLFVLTMIPVTWLTFYTIVKSKRLSDFLEALSDERMSARDKLGSLLAVWRGAPKPD